MLESAWIFVGRVAAVWTIMTLVAAGFVSDVGRGDGFVSNSGVVGFLLWGVWTFGALNIEVVDNGTTVTHTQPELAFLGIVMALVPGYIALTGPIELIQRARDPATDEV